MSSRRSAGRDPLDSITIHIGDWCASTTVARLGSAGEANYLRLLMHQWLSEGEGLTANEDELRTMLRLSKPEWSAFWRIAETKFPVDDDGRRRNPRTHAEWQHCRASRDGVRRRASSGGKAKAAALALLKQPPSTTQEAPGQRSGISPSPAPSPAPTQKSSSTALQQLGDSPVVLPRTRDETAGILPIEALADRALARVRGGAA